MNLKEFDKTSIRGIYKSKKVYPKFGKKYVARFQLNRKRYMKVLGYSSKDSITDKKALTILNTYRKTIVEGREKIVANKPNNKTEEATSKESTQYKNIDLETPMEVSKTPNQIKIKKMHEFVTKNCSDLDFVMLEDGIRKIKNNEMFKQYQVELLKMQKHLENTNKKMIILFEGRDASGKGGAIRKITRYMDAKHYSIVALGKPTPTQLHQWYFQKYTMNFPINGEVVLYDRSWYNRAMVEPVFGFCTKEQYDTFMNGVVDFEKDLVNNEIILIKLYFSVSKQVQLERFNSRRKNPLKRWKLSEVDLQAQELWDDFSEKKYEMLKETSSKHAPWNIIRSESKFKARLEAIKIILNSIEYENKNKVLDYSADKNINISVQKELSRMRKAKDY